MKKNYRKKKFNKKRKNTYKIFFLILVGMTLGFAAINTTLQLIGTLNISKTTWNIHWDNPTKTGGVAATTEVKLKDGDNTTVEYQVDLKNPGDYYEFTVDAKNEGTIDGMITGISNKVYENNTEVTKPDYLDFIVTYGDGTTIANNHLLRSNKKESYKVKVVYKTGLAADELPTQTRNLKFTFQVTYMQADKNTSINRLIILPTGKNKNNLEVGDEICINDEINECFNFIRYDGNDIVMLAKYNLKVGNIYEHRYEEYSRHDKIGEYTSSDSGYGLQSSEALGNTCYVGNCDGIKTYGTVPFSKEDYWLESGTLKPKYGTSFPVDVYDNEYKTEPNSTDGFNTEGYSVAYYVEEYKKVLENYGMSIKEARLLTAAEAQDSSIGCSISSHNCPTSSFITNTAFWLATAGGVKYDESIWYVTTDGNFGSDGASIYNNSSGYGVRPVIVISKSNIN